MFNQERTELLQTSCDKCRQQLTDTLGLIEDSAIPTLVQRAQALQAFSSRQASGASAASSRGAAAPVSEQRIYGADLDFRQPRVYASADEAVLAMCDAAPGAATAAPPRCPSPPFQSWRSLSECEPSKHLKFKNLFDFASAHGAPSWLQKYCRLIVARCTRDRDTPSWVLST